MRLLDSLQNQDGVDSFSIELLRRLDVVPEIVNRNELELLRFRDQALELRRGVNPQSDVVGQSERFFVVLDEHRDSQFLQSRLHAGFDDGECVVDRQVIFFGGPSFGAP